MNKRLASKLICKRISSLRCSAGYFFRDDFEHVLTGIAFEYVTGGVYIWKFYFPLFDFFGP